MSIELKQYLVAFIDLLGFSSMVAHDCSSPNGEQRYIESLHDCHIETKGLKAEYPDLQLIQFSDSVVFALPYSSNNYISIISIISDYQYNLLKKGILCRGGVSYGKHFFEEDFLFSNGMIEAYRLESQVAVSPRVVVSSDLFELVKPILAANQTVATLLFEQDGLWFIDYLSGRDATETWESISKAIPSELSKSSSIRSKQIWLIDYYNHSFPKDRRVNYEKFGAVQP
jgi:hypothetical protein